MLLVLHVWMVHKRLLTEGKRGLLVQESLFDTLWDNTSDRRAFLCQRWRDSG